MVIQKHGPLRGELAVPGDKSISHRSVMFGALSEGITEAENFLTGADCLSTISCFRQMGISVEQNGTSVVVHGKGLHGLIRPSGIIDAGNSGTTVRLLSGILAGQPFDSTITGDASIQKRPMKRVMTPLSQMGASITSVHENGCAPLQIKGSPLHGIHYLSPVASAQVKSCVLLAGLYADAPTSVTEPAISRNHSELMLRYFGADICGKFLRVSTPLFLVHLNQTFTNQVKIICRIKSEADDMVCIHAGFQQVMVKQIVQQKGFAASSDTGDDLNETVVFPLDQFFQIEISANFHIGSPLQ